jgi:hypothetical protein
MCAHIGEAIHLFLVTSDQEGFVQETWQKGEWKAGSGFGNRRCISNELPGRRKDLFPNDGNMTRIIIERGVKGLRPGNIGVYRLHCGLFGR